MKIPRVNVIVCNDLLFHFLLLFKLSVLKIGFRFVFGFIVGNFLFKNLDPVEGAQ